MTPNPQLLLAWLARALTSLLILSVPSEFWVQVVALLDIPDEVKTAIAPFIGATCWTIVEVIQTSMEIEALRRAGKVDEHYQDPGVKYWPLKIFVGSMTGLICMALFSPAVLAIIPKAPEWAIGFIGGAAGYWFMSKKLPQLLSKNDDDNDA